MDELTEDELERFKKSNRPWHRLPSTCTHEGKPLYLRTCAGDASSLIALLTDIASTVWLEYIGDARALHIRIKVSAREGPNSSKSPYTDLKQQDAASKLLEDLDDYFSYADSQATLDAKSDSEMELVLQLRDIPFRLRMDKVSPALQTRVLYDLVYAPIFGILRATDTSGMLDWRSLPKAIDTHANQEPNEDQSQMLFAMQRFGQAASSVPMKQRVAIQPIAERPQASTSASPSTRPSRTSEKHEKASPRRRKTKSPESDDPDKTILSSPDKDGGGDRNASDLPPPAQNTRAASRQAKSGSPSPAPSPSPSRSPSPTQAPTSSAKRKGKSRRVAESPAPDDKPADSDATQSSGNEGASKEQGVESTRATPAKAGSAAASGPNKGKEVEKPEPRREVTSPTRAGAKAAKDDDNEPEQARSPQAPVLKRPTAGAARGAATKRGKRGGMQWSNFG